MAASACCYLRIADVRLRSMLMPPSGTIYEEMWYAEATQVMLDTGKELAQFEAMIKTYFEDTFTKIELNDGSTVMQRGDARDSGQAYRNVIGIPGGVEG